jgi:hypothetical protein
MPSSAEPSWRAGYEAALNDLEQLAARLRARGEEHNLGQLVAELRAGLTTGHAIDPARAEAPAVNREWTEG